MYLQRYYYSAAGYGCEDKENEIVELMMQQIIYCHQYAGAVGYTNIQATN